MNDERCYSGAAGGKNSLSSSQACDGKINKWNQISNLKQRRFENKSAASVGYLYTMEGYNGRNYILLMERLDEFDKSWKSVSSMRTPRSLLAAVSFDDVIYAMTNVMKSVEK